MKPSNTNKNHACGFLTIWNKYRCLPSLKEIHIVELVQLYRKLQRPLNFRHDTLRLITCRVRGERHNEAAVTHLHFYEYHRHQMRNKHRPDASLSQSKCSAVNVIVITAWIIRIITTHWIVLPLRYISIRYQIHAKLVMTRNPLRPFKVSQRCLWCLCFTHKQSEVQLSSYAQKKRTICQIQCLLPVDAI